MNKELKKAFGTIEKHIKKEYGPKCKEYEDLCCVCRIWFLFENLKEYSEE